MTFFPASRVLIFLSALVAAAGTWAQTPPPPAKYVIETSELRALPRAANGNRYLLHIALPSDYAKQPDKRYPVLYTCDGNWSFTLLCGLYGGLLYDRAIPDYILVGIGYPVSDQAIAQFRSYDYLPVPSPDDKEGKKTGHAAEFLEVIQNEIIPYVEREYRVDSNYRVLAGGSAGGTFTLYTLFTKPTLFQGYIAISPGVGATSGLPAVEEKFARSGRQLPVRLFMSGASEEWPDFLETIRKFDTVLQDRSYTRFSYQFRVIEGQGHGGTAAESFSRGIPFVFRPLVKKPAQ